MQVVFAMALSRAAGSLRLGRSRPSSCSAVCPGWLSTAWHAREAHLLSEALWIAQLLTLPAFNLRLLGFKCPECQGWSRVTWGPATAQGAGLVDLPRSLPARHLCDSLTVLALDLGA